MLKWRLFQDKLMVQDEVNMLLQKVGNHSPMTRINIHSFICVLLI